MNKGNKLYEVKQKLFTKLKIKTWLFSTLKMMQQPLII